MSLPQKPLYARKKLEAENKKLKKKIAELKAELKMLKSATVTLPANYSFLYDKAEDIYNEEVKNG